jgi:hypothetical protein
VSDDDPVPTSFIVETNKGGMPITICSCGVLMFKPMAARHYKTCPAYLADTATPDE